MDPVQFYDVDANSLDPDSTNYDARGRVNSAASFQSGIFDVSLNNGSEWDTTKTSVIDTLAVNSGSQVDVANGSNLTADTITLNGGSAMNIGEGGYVDTDHLTVDTFSTVTLADDVSSAWSDDALYANTITVTHGGMLDIQTNNTNADSVIDTDTLELTSSNVADNNGNVYAGVFNIHSNDYTLNADLVNDRTGIPLRLTTVTALSR